MTVSLVEIFAAARTHAAPLAAESAGYLLLAVADNVVSAPRAVTAEDVELAGDGGVRLRPLRSAGTSREGSESQLRRLLARALEVSSSVGPALRRAADRTEETGLPALVRELEVALIPVNRSAARRALSRLHRETERARDAGKLERLLHAEPPAPAAVVIEKALSLPAELPEPSPAALPVVELTVAPHRGSLSLQAPPSVELTLTPEPQLAVGEPALTKPEPVVARARERAGSTPRLGTVVTAQTLLGEEEERTERAPRVEEELELTVDVEVPDLDVEVPDVLDAFSPDEETPLLVKNSVAVSEQPLQDPEPSLLPDVLSAMVALHTGFESEEAPTRLRDVVTELRSPEDEALVPAELQVEDAWLTASSLESVAVADTRFVSELVAPEVHDALTWDPGPVIVSLPSSPLPPALFLTEPVLEPSPYVPAVLPARSSDVSQLVDTFHVSGAAEVRELRSALKEMAGLELTPMPQPLLEKR